MRHEYYGFFNQVYGAAWQFKRYANPPGTSQYFTWYAPGKTWNVRYSPDASCGSSPVRVQNQATSNLYYYTPYQPNRAALAAGYGTGDSCSAYGNRNFFQYFTDWFGSTKSYPVTGGIGDAYQRAGGATGYLGIATSAETCGLDQGGCFQLFQGGQIHWTNATGGHATHGAILGRWSANGYERGWMGYPTSDENCTLIKGGCVQLFQNGQVHWTNPTGAQATRGAILDRWASTGYERGELGYPMTSETCGLVRSGCSQTFENGLITWSSGSGAHILAGVYRQAWTDAGRQDGALGFPTTECPAPTACAAKTSRAGRCFAAERGRCRSSAGRSRRHGMPLEVSTASSASRHLRKPAGWSARGASSTSRAVRSTGALRLAPTRPAARSRTFGARSGGRVAPSAIRPVISSARATRRASRSSNAERSPARRPVPSMR